MSNNIGNPDFTIADLKKIADHNLKQTQSFMEHRFHWSIKEFSDEKFSSRFSSNDLAGIILDPAKSVDIELSDINLAEVLDDQNEEFLDSYNGEREVKTYIKLLEEAKKKEAKKNLFLEKQKDVLVVGAYKNVKIVNFINEFDYFANSLTTLGVTKALLLTDTFYTRDTDFYKKISSILNKMRIPFVEFTNAQPNLDRKDIFKMVEFVNDHEVNCVIAIGSASIVDISKILLSKLLKPSIFRLNQQKPSNNFPKYSVLTIPTIVTPDPRFNSKSVINNKVLFPKLDMFGNVLFLKNEIDDADAVFYCMEIFDILSAEKLTQILHETFFRLIFNYFDLSAGESLLEVIVTNIKSIERMLEINSFKQDLSVDDKFHLLTIISSTMDGRSIIDNNEFWLWYKLEGALSFLVNSKKSDGLALFLPSYLEIMAANSYEFNKRICELGTKLYGSYSVEGFIYRIILHIKKYKLPISLLDIKEIKRVDYKFLHTLIKKSSLGIYASKFHKAILKNLTNL